ncbi:MAG: MmcQ/YjbR family DNA-binding protein [Ferruginibacter sp.]
MNVEDLRAYVLQKENVTEGFPFGEDTLVFKVENKIFVLVSLDEPTLRMNVKCDPEKAIEWREEYPENVLPGYHMNKKHWNTVLAAGLKTNLVKQMIDESYHLVAKKKK